MSCEPFFSYIMARRGSEFYIMARRGSDLLLFNTNSAIL